MSYLNDIVVIKNIYYYIYVNFSFLFKIYAVLLLSEEVLRDCDLEGKRGVCSVFFRKIRYD